MFIVVTGPDLAGKSTIIPNLWNQFKPDVQYKGMRPKDSQEAEDTLWKVLLNHIRTGDSYICDRFNFPDEIIYARVFGSTPAIRLEDQEAGIRRLLMEINAFFIYVTADVDILLKRYADRGDEHVDEEMITKAHDLYESFFSGTNLPFTLIDTTWATPEQVDQQVWAHVKKFKWCIDNNFQWRNSMKRWD